MPFSYEQPIETIASSEWLGAMRNELDAITEQGLRPIDLPDDKQTILVELRLASQQLMWKLGIAAGPNELKRKVSGMKGPDAEVTAQLSTPTFKVNYHPMITPNIDETALIPESGYGRVVVIKKERFKTRPFIPLSLGNLALGQKLEEAVYRGVEFNSHLPVHPAPLEADPFWLYCTLNESGKNDFLPRWAANDGGVENTSGLIEGLHAIAVSARQAGLDTVSAYQKTRT